MRGATPQSVHRSRQRAAPKRAIAVVAALAPLLALLLAGCGALAGAWRLLTPPDSHVISLASDPHIPTLIYAGSDDGAVYRARADQPGLAAPGAGIPATAAVAALSPDPKIAGRVLAGTTAGLYKSDHYGDNWSAYGQGLPTNFATVALATAPDDSVLLAGTDSHGIYRSADNGATWAVASAGLPSDATVTALTWDATDHLWWAGLTGGASHSIYQSADGGQTWQASDQLIKTGVDINGLATVQSPGSGDADSVFAATSAGVYISTGGGNWAKAHGALPATAALAVTALPDKPGAVIVSLGASVYASTDGGATWSIVAKGLTHPVAALGVTHDKKGAPVYFAASGQLARYPSGANATSDSTSYLLVTLIAALLVGGGYLIMRRGRSFGYAMGANDNEATAGPGAAAARARERQRAAQAAANEPGSGRRAWRSRGGALAPDDLTSRKQTGAPAKSDKAASNGHGDPKMRG